MEIIVIWINKANLVKCVGLDVVVHGGRLYNDMVATGNGHDVVINLSCSARRDSDAVRLAIYDRVVVKKPVFAAIPPNAIALIIVEACIHDDIVINLIVALSHHKHPAQTSADDHIIIPISGAAPADRQAGPGVATANVWVATNVLDIIMVYFDICYSTGDLNTLVTAALDPIVCYLNPLNFRLYTIMPVCAAYVETLVGNVVYVVMMNIEVIATPGLPGLIRGLPRPDASFVRIVDFNMVNLQIPRSLAHVGRDPTIGHIENLEAVFD